MRGRRRPVAPPVYAIVDAAALTGRDIAPAVVELAAAGIGWLQVRAKTLPGAELYRQVERCCRALEGSGVALWVDDRVDVAALLPVDGVHLGQEDLPPAAARTVVGRGVWIGQSTHDETQLVAADRDPEVDVIALGPIYPTRGKERPDPIVGLGELARLRPRTHKPLVAIGGIDAGNLAAVLAAGADAAAVLGAICRGDLTANAARLLAVARGAW